MHIIDTDILIYYMRNPEIHTRLFLRIEELTREALFTTVINYSELLYGSLSSPTLSTSFIEKSRYFMEHFSILEFDEVAADLFVKIKAKLKRAGSILPDADLMIASIVMANDAILVTHNTKHFSRIKGLNLEDWLVR